MKIERTRNTVRNSVWGILSKIITTFFPVIVRTLIVQYIGAAYLGLGSLFSSILTVLSLAELGVSTAIVFSMYKPIAEDDTNTICALMALYKKLYSVIGTVIGIIGLLLMPFLPYLIKGEYPSDINLYLLYLIYLGNTVIGYFLFAYKNCLLTAHQRTDISTKIGIGTSIVQYIIAIVTIILLKNYYVYAILAPIASIVNNLLTAHCVDKMFPDYKPRGRLDKGKIADIKQRIAGLMLSKVAGTTRNTFDSIFISAFLGLTTVTIYGNYYYIMAAIISFLAVLTGGMSAGIGNSVAVDSVEKNYYDFKKFSFMFGWISGWCTICLACLYQPAMRIWMGGDLMFADDVPFLFALYFYTLTINSIKDQYYNAAGLWWTGKWRTIIEAVANFVLNIVLGKILGVYGIIFATIITALIVNFGYGTQLVYKNYFVGYPMREIMIEQGKYFFVTVINLAATYVICIKIPVSGFIGLLAKCVVCVMAPNIIYYILYRKSPYFEDALKMLKRMIRK